MGVLVCYCMSSSLFRNGRVCQHTPRVSESLLLGGFSLCSFCACLTLRIPVAFLQTREQHSQHHHDSLAPSLPLPILSNPGTKLTWAAPAPCPSYKTRINIRGTSRSRLIYCAPVLSIRNALQQRPHSRLPRIYQIKDKHLTGIVSRRLMRELSLKIATNESGSPGDRGCSLVDTRLLVLGSPKDVVR